MSNYAKHKDRAPQDTIFEIQRILNSLGLFPVINYIEKEFDGVRSNRVELYPSTLGTNGKGTDELFATASGYAELIERIQNNLLSSHRRRPQLETYGGFCDFHDEKEFTLAELVDQNDPYLRNIFKILLRYTKETKIGLLRHINEISNFRDDDKMKAVPFVEPFANRLVYIPLRLAFIFCGSNGMAAGNTLEEAFVQGMAEIFERKANRDVISGEVVPPEIPRKYLEGYSFWNLVQKIEQNGRYKVSVRDCSLGRNFPVAATIIFDKEKGTLGVKFGSHPSMAVAVERTFTEAFQGNKLADFTSNNKIGNDDLALNYSNIPNVTKVGSGFYSYKMLVGEPDYEFKEWTYWQAQSNRDFFKKMLALLKEQGYSPLFRDSSHLGFPACYILVPGLSEAFHISELRLREFTSQKKIYDSFFRFPNLTEEEEMRLLKMIQFKQNSVLENEIGFITRRPIKEGLMSGNRIAAFISLKHGHFEDAVNYFIKFSETYAGTDEHFYWDCLLEYSRLLLCGIERESAHAAIRQLFQKEIADRVIFETEDPAQMMQRVFPKTNCYDCENCELSGKYCSMLVNEKILMKIKAGLAESKVSQAALLEYLKNI
jgi:ribosomal protein S12 methylthiotransferase accessory factor